MTAAGFVPVAEMCLLKLVVPYSFYTGSFFAQCVYCWLTDNKDTTCSRENLGSVTVTLDTPIPLTWLRVVVSDAGQNVALKQRAKQSSWFHNDFRDRWWAEYALDGKIPKNTKHSRTF
ncbi:hypothetical protein RRG08_059703 [Elysia crispata]|uniref:Uncharacterized protein n=1 Tax=Elysia crispata TaxID=231223 RepID=A0AAE1AC96_9GAST|nr:hypothetical protein RRG08_059703 [Elysia crispata]